MERAASLFSWPFVARALCLREQCVVKALICGQIRGNTVRNFRRPRFTLIELAVVIAIIAMLAAILFPVFARARENARRWSSLS